MRWQVVELFGEHEQVIERDLTAGAATALRSLLTALQTDGDPRRYIIRQQTGFES